MDDLWKTDNRAKGAGTVLVFLVVHGWPMEDNWLMMTEKFVGDVGTSPELFRSVLSMKYENQPTGYPPNFLYNLTFPGNYLTCQKVAPILTVCITKINQLLILVTFSSWQSFTLSTVIESAALPLQIGENVEHFLPQTILHRDRKHLRQQKDIFRTHIYCFSWCTYTEQL